MSNNISLTASMRSNLLSLQNVSKQIDVTQNRLSTGKKVNSAIDNPSSYYTARALNNRADDLNALLDSMGQMISTIKAANEGIEASLSMLEQMQSVAEQALDSGGSKSSSADSSSGVSLKNNAAELIAQGYTAIDSSMSLSEINDILAQDNAKVVLTEDLSFDSGLDIYGKNVVLNGAGHKISIDGENIYISKDDSLIENISVDVKNSTVGVIGHGSIKNANVYFEGRTGDGYANAALQDLIFIENVNINVKGGGDVAVGIYERNSSAASIKNVRIDITSSAGATGGIAVAIPTQINNVEMNITATLEDAIVAGVGTFWPDFVVIDNDKNMQLNGGAQQIKFAGIDGSYNVTGDISDQINFTDPDGGTEEPDEDANKDENAVSYDEYITQFSQIYNQYNMLINDASYKGVNMLKGDTLTVNFNEDRSSTYVLNGRDISAANLGINIADWKTFDDVQNTLDSIRSAILDLRNYSAELGNGYSIIQNRQDFTENLVNILTEGADKLTLADMNEESANMLALQTRQQLAINALSLASQANQAVLKLF